MRAVEVVARALALAYVQGRIGASPDVDADTDTRIDTYVERRWRDHESAAKRLLRGLKDQPPHVLDAAARCLSPQVGFNEMLEAMARG